MSESGSTTTKPVPALTRKGETLPKWADLLKNELFVVLERLFTGKIIITFRTAFFTFFLKI